MFHRSYFFISLIFLIGIFAFSNPCLARENATDWYVQNFDAQIIVNRDSSLDITETITADCGTAVGKHGIFRIVPEEIRVEGQEVIKTPIKLLSITDENGEAYGYSESRNSTDSTVTWKIGDANETVQGVHIYVIKYRVANTIRFWNNKFDEWYWNLTGNFWDLEMDKVHVKVIFPVEVRKENSMVDLYAGSLGERGSALATYKWTADNILEFDSTGILAKKQGITTAVTFPKNIFVPYQPSWWELYARYVFLAIPMTVLFFCLRLWLVYGKDPQMDRAIIAEYEAPLEMSPLEMGMLMTNGGLRNNFITAEIINLATNKILTIREIDNKFFFFHSKDYEFSRSRNTSAEAALNSGQKAILNKLFEDGDVIELSSLRNSFYKIIADVKKKGVDILLKKNLIYQSGMNFALSFGIVGAIVFMGGAGLIAVSGWLALAIILSGVIIFLFGLVMPKRTVAGAEANWKIKGFKLFMETVDKDRAAFYEKENIFEKFLPYAIVFGITGLWVKKMKELYGEEYFSQHVPLWYAGNLAAFDADSFASEMDNLSASIAANTSAPSGSGGSGGSGGGGGGGGGGGW
jgi:uncharacterized membrane protein